MKKESEMKWLGAKLPNPLQCKKHRQKSYPKAMFLIIYLIILAKRMNAADCHLHSHFPPHIIHPSSHSRTIFITVLFILFVCYIKKQRFPEQ